MNYTEMMSVFSSGDMGVDIPDGIICALPIIGLRDNKPIDVLFTYVISKAGELSHPRMVYAIDSSKNEIVYEQSIQGTGTDYPYKSLIAKSTVDFQAALTIRKKYVELYEAIHDIAFQPTLTQEQVAKVREFMDTFSKAIEPAYEPFYREIAPEFFQWAADSMGKR